MNTVKLYVQDPETCDDQGIYVRFPGDPDPEIYVQDPEEFDEWLNPSEGFYIANQESAETWFKRSYRPDIVAKYDVQLIWI